MNKDLKTIKKLFGENMMQLCRKYFANILEQPGVLSEIILDNFEPSRFLYEDIMNNKTYDEDIYIYEFVNFIQNIFRQKYNKLIYRDVDRDAKDLLSEAGYELYRCETDEEIAYFEKYFKEDEALCTFKGNRLERSHVFFAVKKNVDEIKRENFITPNRQDEYGTSVMSIQFDKSFPHTLSITNRYNLKVENPDATFENNLDNIIPGLTKGFEKSYGMIQEFKAIAFDLPGYTLANDGKFYKYNYEINNVFYCPNNIIIDNGNVIKYPKEKYLLCDYYLLSLEKQNDQSINASLYDNKLTDCFCSVLPKIKNVNIINNPQDESKLVILSSLEGEDIVIKLNKYNQIIGYKNNNIESIATSFMFYNKLLTTFIANEVQEIDKNFLYFNRNLKQLEIPKLKDIKYPYFRYNENCEEKVDSIIESNGRSR